MELKEDSYYWLQDETDKLSICCYIGNNEVVFVGCEIKFKLNDGWRIISEIVCDGKKSDTRNESAKVCSNCKYDEDGWECTHEPVCDGNYEFWEKQT